MDINLCSPKREMEFVEGKLEEEKVFGDLVFPKTLNPPIDNGTSELLVEMIKEKREWLSDLLRRHNAIFFRGFNVSSPEEFRQVVEAFEWDEMPYMGPTNRIMVANRIYNANEAPLDQFINFHHEMFLTKQYPSKILFLCTQPSPEGGETCILPSHVIVSKMEKEVPEFVSQLETNGFVFKIKTAKVNSNAILGTTWKSYLNTEDEVEAKKRSMEKLGCNSVKLNEDGSAEFVYGPLNPIRELGGKRVWFIPIVRHSAIKRDTTTSFGDGSPLPSKGLETYQKILDEVCVDIKWQKGDVMLLDNLSVQHGRRPAKPPRSVFVSLCK